MVLYLWVVILFCHVMIMKPKITPCVGGPYTYQIFDNNKECTYFQKNHLKKYEQNDELRSWTKITNHEASNHSFENWTLRDNWSKVEWLKAVFISLIWQSHMSKKKLHISFPLISYTKKYSKCEKFYSGNSSNNFFSYFAITL